MMTRARDENRVLARRKELGLHITTLASRAQKSAGLISMIEGGFCPKLPTMLRIADALDTTPSDLWPDEFRVTVDANGDLHGPGEGADVG